MSYDNPSALTLNAGAGFKAWFTPMIGLRVDVRVFYAPSAKFAQTYSYKIFGVNQFSRGQLCDPERSRLRRGDHGGSGHPPGQLTLV